jgi:dTDP-glucose 4,6-dehydratase
VRLLVTGGAGFIGSNFIKYIYKNFPEHLSEVIVLDKLTYAGVEANLESVSNNIGYQFVRGDICDTKIVTQLVDSVDSIINFAAESHVDNSIISAESFVKTNISGVQVLLEAVKAAGGKKRFVQVSTDEVYGSIEYGSWTEESPLLPNSPYSASKASGELLARAYQRTHNLDVVITRCSNNYGPFQHPEKLIPFFVTNLLQGKNVPVYGNGKNVRDWLHVDDHCQAIYKVLMNGVSGEVYNIGGGSELANLEITRLILAQMGKSESFIQYVSDRKGHDFRYSVNWGKINRDLGYYPEINFEEGLKQTINWYTENLPWWENLKIDSH